jgi:hypothetical protein
MANSNNHYVLILALLIIIQINFEDNKLIQAITSLSAAIWISYGIYLMLKHRM